MSFFPLKDASGTVQLLVKDDHLESLSNIPVESSVLIEGTVLLRPPSARRPVSLHCNCSLSASIDDWRRPLGPSWGY